ncbi:MAG: V-type ATP synthase subunit D [Candidatus Riflebacteria bacterium]|nr:V-type ATP synthase subunit D [Candidatus Riflebacteria bacterium]
MAEKIKKTRPELLKLRRGLALFKRFLPTLHLKKQQIQLEIVKIRSEFKRLKDEISRRLEQIENWISLFSEDLPGPVTRLVQVVAARHGEKNVAGIVLPVLLEMEYKVMPYSYFSAPPWVDKGVVMVKELLEFREKINVIKKQEEILHIELRKITQRVNLFEKVKIPQTIESIRVIKIALAEEQTAGVGRAKIAKGKSVPVENAVMEASV